MVLCTTNNFEKLFVQFIRANAQVFFEATQKPSCRTGPVQSIQFCCNLKQNRNMLRMQNFMIAYKNLQLMQRS